MSEYNLTISTFKDSTKMSFSGLDSIEMQYGFKEFTKITQIYYGGNFSDEAIKLFDKIENKYLNAGVLKHHQSALALLFKGLGQYLLEEYFPVKIAQRIMNMPIDSTINLILNDEASVVPWELIHTGRNFLCLDHVIGRKNTETQIRKPQRKRTIPMLMVSDPTGDLPGAQTEANYILGKLRGSNIQVERFGSEIHKRQYVELLESGKYDIIHYSGHSASSTEPGESYHWFMDGPLFGFEIEEMKGDMPFLVFSNSCESAGSSLSLEDAGNTSLAGSYLKAGVSGCIAAIWAVNDQGSGEFASDFYRYLLFGNTVGVSMLNSRRNAFKRWGFLDLIWGSYIYYGDPKLKLI